MKSLDQSLLSFSDQIKISNSIRNNFIVIEMLLSCMHFTFFLFGDIKKAKSEKEKFEKVNFKVSIFHRHASNTNYCFVEFHSQFSIFFEQKTKRKEIYVYCKTCSILTRKFLNAFSIEFSSLTIRSFQPFNFTLRFHVDFVQKILDS